MISAFKTLLSLMLSFMCLFSGAVFGNWAGDYAPADAENVRLSFAVISDTHINDSPVRKTLLELGLCDMQNAEYPPDALVIAGDITDMANASHYEALEDAFSKYTPAKQIYFALGNHDTWNEEADDDNRYPESRRLFLEYNRKICSRELEKPYYSAEINGYPFIFLASEADSTNAFISDAQLLWLEGEMAKAAATGLPIFVVSHQSLNGSHGLPATWGEKDPQPDDGGLGDQSEAVEKILKKYDNVFYISGHIHNGFANESQKDLYGYTSVESDGSFHSINLPAYTLPGIRGRISTGTGYQIEVYDNEVLIRARSFSAGVWYTQYDCTIVLT